MTIEVTMTVMMLIKGLIQAHVWVVLQEEAAMFPLTWKFIYRNRAHSPDNFGKNVVSTKFTTTAVP